MIEHGRVLAVEEELKGSELTSNTIIGATVYPVATTVDFDETGGQFTLGAETITYTAVDDVALTVTGSAAASAHSAGDRVNVYPRAVERWAHVIIDDVDDEAVEALVPHALYKLLFPGMRDGTGTARESVTISEESGRWTIQDVLGKEPLARTYDAARNVLSEENDPTGQVVYRTGPPGSTHWELTSLSNDQLLGYFSDRTLPSQLYLQINGFLGLYPQRNVGDKVPSLNFQSGDASTAYVALDNDNGSRIELAAAINSIVYRTSDFKLDTGYQARGYCSVQAKVVANGDQFGHGVTFGALSTLTNVPSSITFTLQGTDGLVTSVGSTTMTIRGFRFFVTASGAGNCHADRTYVTVGN